MRVQLFGRALRRGEAFCNAGDTCMHYCVVGWGGVRCAGRLVRRCSRARGRVQRHDHMQHYDCVKHHVQIGMFGVVAVLMVVGERNATDISIYFSPALNWVAKWLPLFYVSTFCPRRGWVEGVLGGGIL